MNIRFATSVDKDQIHQLLDQMSLMFKASDVPSKIGGSIFDSIKEYCKKNNIHVVKLDSDVNLEAAHKFYEKNGGKFTEKMFRFDL